LAKTLKVKVKSTLEQTTKTQKGSRGIKLPIHVRVWLASPAGLGFQ